MRPRISARRPLLFVLGTTVAAMLSVGGLQPCFAEEDSEATAAKTTRVTSANPKTTVSGRDIFLREWLPNDPRSHGGDGLGPVFNDSSCIACHNQGGVGGGGPASKNVDIVSAALSNPPQTMIQSRTVVGSLIGAVFGNRRQLQLKQPKPLTPEQLKKRREQLVKEVTRIHPGFGSARSVVVHKFGVEKKYEAWRLHITGKDQFTGMGFRPQVMSVRSGIVVVDKLTQETPIISNPSDTKLESRVLARNKLNQANREISAAQTASVDFNGPFFPGARNQGNFTISTSKRNPTALFGVGLIDSIPAKALEEAAKQRFNEFPQVSGRVAKLPDGKIGRFGWKAQKASLYDFTMTACAVELGLHVPDHPQSGLPSKPDYKPAGYDLNQQECDALVKYLRELPAPATHKPAAEIEAKYLHDGAALFASVGCAACHTEKLGEVSGIFSDLLLHDMGPNLGDTGSYGVFIPDSPGSDAESPVPPLAELQKQQARPQSADVAKAKQPTHGAGRLEWRTPPLWGVRDSAPYLHDGRAKNLEQAIAFHGGEGTDSAQRYFLLSSAERLKVQAFLKTLVAPAPRQLARK